MCEKILLVLDVDFFNTFYRSCTPDNKLDKLKYELLLNCYQETPE